jgi:MoaA/NifB/PqqE/SkfB family radical SAM enzyme
MKNYIRLTMKQFRRPAKVALLRAPFVVPPEQIQIDITDRCNYRCPTCSKWLQKSAENELTCRQWQEFLTRSAPLPFSGRVVFSGGEPLLRPDVVDLVGHAARLGLKPVLVTNGSLLTEEKISSLQDAGLDYLMVSMNALEAKVHDSTRNAEGSFDRITEAIEKYLSIKGAMSMGITSILMEENRDQIVPLVEFATRSGLHGILFQALMDSRVHAPFRASTGDDSLPGTDGIHPEPNRMDEVIDELLLRQRRGFRILNAPSQLKAMKAFFRTPQNYHGVACAAGLTSFLVDAYGDVRLCFSLPPIGNIRSGHPADIWKSPQAAEVRRCISRCSLPCRIMNHIY